MEHSRIIKEETIEIELPKVCHSDNRKKGIYHTITAVPSRSSLNNL
jgi:hypothetical protein